MHQRSLCVIGSINMDLVVGTERFPQPGETLTGTRFSTVPGGKGANQAVALARLGAKVRMVGRIGQDVFGDQYMRHFQSEGVDVSLVERGNLPTGVALIEVDAAGENKIIVVPGANHAVDPGWTERVLPLIDASGLVLMQLEIPMNTVLDVARHIRTCGGTLLLDPAPMQPVPEELLSLATVITPNEHELCSLTPELPSDVSFENRIVALARRSSAIVLHKRGPAGAYLWTPRGIRHFPAYKVKAVDSTAAGDAFNAGLAYALAQGWEMDDCVRLACAVGALSVTNFGAQDGMPELSEAIQMIRQGL